MEDVKDNNESKNTEVVSTQEKKQINLNQEEITIMPTMIDTSGEKVEKARDLSSIIPQNSSFQSSKDGVALTSRDKELKSDGSTILATIDDNIDMTLIPEAKLPEQIDVEARKIEQQKNKVNKKRVNNQKKSMKKEHQMQNIISIIAIIAIIIIGYTAYNYFYGPKDSDFVVKNLTIEVGTALPIRASSYVTPGVGKEATDYDYVINKDKVIIDRVGEYTYTVTHNGITKTGKITIVDTTPPVVKVRDYVTIREGTEFDPSKFISECNEQEGCTFSYQEPAKVATYKTPGVYTIYVVASDIYGNSTTSKVTLIIESQAKAKRYVKKTPYDFNSGYELTEIYELHFDEFSSYSLLTSGKRITVRKYQDETVYEKAVKEFEGEPNYSFKDSDKTMTLTEIIDVVGNNYSTPEDVDKYLINNGFVEEYE